MKMLGMSNLLIFICGFIIADVNAQDCRSGSYYDSVTANKGTFMTDHWYLNTELNCTCSGRVDKYEVKHYSLDQNGQYSVYAAIWKPIGGDIYELDNSSITKVTESNKRRKKRSNTVGTVDAVPSSLYVRKGAIIGVYFDDSTTNNLPVLGSINGYHLCMRASTGISSITTIDCSVESTEGRDRIIHAEAQIVRILCDQSEIPRISHGSSSLPDGDTEYMARVQYTCDTGYEITNGDEYLYCNEDGEWSGTAPTCTVISCPPVADSLTHGTVNGWDNSNYMSVVTFSCNNGYQLNGDSSVTCQANGQWSGVIPTECTWPDETTTGAKLTVNSSPLVATATLSSTVSNAVSVVATFTTQSPTTVQVITTFTHNSISTTAVLTVVSSSTSVLAAGYSSSSVSQSIPIDHITPRHSSIPSVTHFTFYDSSSSRVVPQPPSALIKSFTTTAAVLQTHTRDQLLTNSVSSHQLSSTTQPDSSPSQTRIADASSASSGVQSSIGIAVGILVIVIVGLVAIIVVLVLVYKNRRKSQHKIANNDGSTNPSPGLINRNYDNVINTKKRFSAGLINSNYDDQQHTAIPAINTVSNPEYTGNIPLVTYEPVDSYQFDTLTMENAIYSELDENKQSLPPLPPANSISLALSDELSVVGGINGVHEVLDSNSDQYYELEDGVFTEEPTYWEPASNTVTLYDQLARRKYRKIPRENITVTDHLGSGQFGSVEKGTWRAQNGVVEVAIKTLKDIASDEDELKFLQEAAINGQFHHPNVVQLCGVVTVGKPTLIVLEYIPNGNLKEFLEGKRPLPSGGMCDDQLASLLIKFSYQIASGMLYLSNKRFIHRDLAARNILVGNNNTCKIADFGMSRDLQDESYYQSNSKRIPVKWTAPEALNFRKYTTQSDVWSYGALLYEIWSVGYKPFEQYTNQECIRLVDSGYRLASPPGCPRTVYSMMIDCWNPSAKKRPTFQYLISTFQSAMVNGIYEEAMELKSALGYPLNNDKSLYPDLQNKYT